MLKVKDAGYKSGLPNSNQSCYLNASLQLLFRMTDLMDFINKIKDENNTLVIQLLKTIFELWNNKSIISKEFYEIFVIAMKSDSEYQDIPVDFDTQESSMFTLTNLSNYILKKLPNELKKNYMNLYVLDKTRTVDNWEPNIWYTEFKDGLEEENGTYTCPLLTLRKEEEDGFYNIEIDIDIDIDSSNIIIDIGKQIKSIFHYYSKIDSMYCTTQYDIVEKLIKTKEALLKDDSSQELSAEILLLQKHLENIRNKKNTPTILHKIIKAPKYMIIYNKYRLNREKGQKEVLTRREFKEIIINPIVEIKSDISYKLLGFISHSGTATGGHYVFVAYENDNFILYNDTIITKLSGDSFKEIKNNMEFCLYEKVETKSPSQSSAQAPPVPTSQSSAKAPPVPASQSSAPAAPAASAPASAPSQAPGLVLSSEIINYDKTKHKTVVIILKTIQLDILADIKYIKECDFDEELLEIYEHLLKCCYDKLNKFIIFPIDNDDIVNIIKQKQKQSMDNITELNLIDNTIDNFIVNKNILRDLRITKMKLVILNMNDLLPKYNSKEELILNFIKKFKIVDMKTYYHNKVNKNNEEINNKIKKDILDKYEMINQDYLFKVIYYKEEHLDNFLKIKYEHLNTYANIIYFKNYKLDTKSLLLKKYEKLYSLYFNKLNKIYINIDNIKKTSSIIKERFINKKIDKLDKLDLNSDDNDNIKRNIKILKDVRIQMIILEILKSDMYEIYSNIEKKINIYFERIIKNMIKYPDKSFVGSKVGSKVGSEDESEDESEVEFLDGFENTVYKYFEKFMIKDDILQDEYISEDMTDEDIDFKIEFYNEKKNKNNPLLFYEKF